MGKQGPCCHCGVTSTPLWRNGPPNKPVLCNACGSRWRTKGSLVNYTPLHARGFAFSDLGKCFGGEKPFLKNKIEDSGVTDRSEHNLEAVVDISKVAVCSENYEKDTGSGTTSESEVSYSASYTQFDSEDGNEITGSVQSPAWDSQIPSKKRTFIKRKSESSVEKLQKDLYDILCEQDSSCLSESSEEVLLFQTEVSMGSVETSLGSVLIKRPHTAEEESEGSSLSENKHHAKDETLTGRASVGSCSASSIAVHNGKLQSIMENKKPRREVFVDKINALVDEVL